MVQIEYIWIGGKLELRSKTRILTPRDFTNISNIPNWNYDGSSTNQAAGIDSEIVIIPRAIYPSPFVKNSYLVMCDTYTPSGVLGKCNHRYDAKLIFDKYLSSHPWYGIEQEYFMFKPNETFPIGYDPNVTQGQYYCSVGTNNAFGRQLAEQHMDYCIKAGLTISGINSEVAPGQWEFQIGPVEGIEACDQLWIARYILEKLSEEHNIVINYHPKPMKGDWNGSGCHVNFSTKEMRENNGLQIILNSMKSMEKNHQIHMAFYGEDNQERMSGLHETSDPNKFTFGIGDRTASIRIPNETYNNNMGYFEDRRPAANMDPYQVCPLILKTVMEKN